MLTRLGLKILSVGKVTELERTVMSITDLTDWQLHQLWQFLVLQTIHRVSVQISAIIVWTRTNFKQDIWSSFKNCRSFDIVRNEELLYFQAPCRQFTLAQDKFKTVYILWELTSLRLFCVCWRLSGHGLWLWMSWPAASSNPIATVSLPPRPPSSPQALTGACKIISVFNSLPFKIPFYSKSSTCSLTDDSNFWFIYLFT